MPQVSSGYFTKQEDNRVYLRGHSTLPMHCKELIAPNIHIQDSLHFSESHHYCVDVHVCMCVDVHVCMCVYVHVCVCVHVCMAILNFGKEYANLPLFK